MQKIKWISAFIAIALAISSPCYAQQWAITYGGSDRDFATSTQQTSDGGYIVAGYTYSFSVDSYDFWVLKLNGNGDVDWQKTYGESGLDTPTSTQQTSDGGYIVAGYTYSFDAGSYDFSVLKLNANGDVDWQKTYWGTDWSYATSTQQTSDGGYIVAGYTYSFDAGSYDFSVLKLNANGDVDWQKTYWGTDWSYATSTQQTSDGGYIVAGYTYSFDAGSYDFSVLKLNGNGDVDWHKTYGGSGWNYANSIQQTSDGGYIVAGYTESFGAGSYDFWVLKLNGNGDVDWQKTYGGSDGDFAYSIQQTSDGGYIVAGETNSFGAGNGDFWVLKLNSNGDVDWQNTYGGSDVDFAYSIQQTSDGGYIVAGETNSFSAGNGDFWVLKLNSDGEIPDCSAMGTSEAIVGNTSIEGQDTTVISQESPVITADTYITPQDTLAEISVVCFVEDVVCVENIENIKMKCFGVNFMKAIDKKKGAKRDKIKIRGSFKLNEEAELFDPGSDVTVTIIPYIPEAGDGQEITIVIPPGLFENKNFLWFHYYCFKGDVPDVGRVHMHLNFDKCRWWIKIYGKDASGLVQSGGVIVELRIGGNVGREESLYWTRTWKRRKISFAKFAERPRTHCCRTHGVGPWFSEPVTSTFNKGCKSP